MLVVLQFRAEHVNLISFLILQIADLLFHKLVFFCEIMHLLLVLHPVLRFFHELLADIPQAMDFFLRFSEFHLQSTLIFTLANPTLQYSTIVR
jgi:hypothetical protein